MSGTTSGVKLATVAGETKMTVFQGKSLRFSIIWGGSNPIDVAGYKAHLQARSGYGDDLMLDLSSENGGAIIGGADGKIDFIATPAQTRQVNKPGRWEIELETPSGEVFRAAAGPVSFEAEVVK